MSMLFNSFTFCKADSFRVTKLKLFPTIVRSDLRCHAVWEKVLLWRLSTWSEKKKEVAKIKGKLFYFLLVFFPICSRENLFSTVGFKCREDLTIKFSLPLESSDFSEGSESIWRAKTTFHIMVSCLCPPYPDPSLRSSSKASQSDPKGLDIMFVQPFLQLGNW